MSCHLSQLLDKHGSPLRQQIGHERRKRRKRRNWKTNHEFRQNSLNSGKNEKNLLVEITMMMNHLARWPNIFPSSQDCRIMYRCWESLRKPGMLLQKNVKTESKLIVS